MVAPDPRQTSLLDALDRSPGGGRPNPVLEADLRQHLKEMTGPGIPSCIRVVHAVERDGLLLTGRIEVFDGQVHTVTVRGTREMIREYGWPDLTEPFGWDALRRRWRRYPEMRAA